MAFSSVRLVAQSPTLTPPADDVVTGMRNPPAQRSRPQRAVERLSGLIAGNGGARVYVPALVEQATRSLTREWLIATFVQLNAAQGKLRRIRSLITIETTQSAFEFSDAPACTG